MASRTGTDTSDKGVAPVDLAGWHNVEKKLLPSETNKVPGANVSLHTHQLFVLRSTATTNIKCGDFKNNRT